MELDNTNLNIKQTIQAYWEDEKVIKELIGQSGESMTFNFGSIPTEKVIVDAKEGKISRIRTFSGMRWSAKSGYGDAVVDTDRS